MAAPPPASLSGRITLVLGLVSLSIAAAFTYVNEDFTWPTGSASESSRFLMGFAVLAVLFQFATPALCASTFFFGVPARRLWIARSGMAAAAVSMALYVRFLAFCARRISDLGG